MKSHINTKKLSKLEVIILMFSISLLPIFFVARSFYKTNSIKDSNFIKITSLVIGIIFLIISILQLIFKRPYLRTVFTCHARLDRSIKCTHSSLGICSRCLGIFIGIILMIPITQISFNYHYLLILGIFLIIDGVLQLKTNYESNNLKRIMTGIMFGPTFVILLSYYFLVITLLSNFILKLF